VPTSRPWGMIVALVAILAVSVGSVWVLVTYQGIFQAPTDVTSVLGSWFTVVGTIVGAYYGIKAGSDANNAAQATIQTTNSTAQGTIQTANNVAYQAMGALPPRDAQTVLERSTTQGQSTTP